jgi:hypothetical protein
MSTFVNYGKRSIQLPAGCKDLIDVLQGRRAQQISAPAGRECQVRDDSFTAKVTDLLQPIADFLKSKALMRNMFISGPNDMVSVGVRVNVEGVHLSICALDEPVRNEAVLNFLARRGFQKPQPHGMPKTFVADAPTWTSYEVIPAPSDPLALSSLIELALRDVGGFSADSEVLIYRVESIKEAAP